MEPHWLHSPERERGPGRPGAGGTPRPLPEPPREPARPPPAPEARREAWAPAAPSRPARAEGGGRELDLKQLLGAVRDSKWQVGLVALGVLLLGLLYLLFATPVYRSDALVQIEDKSRPPSSMDELAYIMYSGETPAEGEIEVLRSRTLIGSVVDELKLDLAVTPRYLPVVGEMLARRHGEATLASAPPGLGRYAWGGEQIEVGRFDVPTDLLDHEHTLVAGEQGSYRLLGPEGKELLRGLVGVPTSVELPDGAGRVELFVSKLIAHPGAQFSVVRHRRDQVVHDLQAQLIVAPKGKEKGTGVLQLSLEGTNPRRVAEVVDAVSKRYLRQNVERRSAEAQKTLEFLDQQIPLQKAAVDTAETALNEYRSGGKGHVDLNLEAQSSLNLVVDLEKKLSEVELQRAELRQRFTENHPTIASLQRQADQLRSSIAEANYRFKKLPESEVKAARLERDARVANEVYLGLLNKAQELRLVKSGTVGNVRILDAAVVPFQPIRPARRLVLALSLMLGLGLGVGYAVLTHRGVRDPEALEASTGLSVYALVPHSPEQFRPAQALTRRRHRKRPVLAVTEPTALAVESLRSLRTSLQFALAEARNNVICVGGPGPQVGKSFVLVNLAHVLAQGGQRVLLVDADLRKGRLQQYFPGGRGVGLAEVLNGTQSLEHALQQGVAPNLDFLARGAIPPNPAEMLASARFEQLVQSASRAYDLVLLDVPPILAVTDAALVARHAGVNLLVLRFGQHEPREISLALKRLEQSGVRANGLVLNDMPLVARRGSDRYGYFYQYDYR